MDITGLGSIFDFGSKVIDKVFPNPEAKAKALFELEQLRQTGELAKMANEADLFKAEVDDRKSARTIHTSFVDFLALAVIAGSTYILYQILFAGLNEKISDMVAGMIIGLFVSSITQVMNYYFGSSSSSKIKTDGLIDAVKKV
jgi:hypothetical protein